MNCGSECPIIFIDDHDDPLSTRMMLGRDMKIHTSGYLCMYYLYCGLGSKYMWCWIIVSPCDESIHRGGYFGLQDHKNALCMFWLISTKLYMYIQLHSNDLGYEGEGLGICIYICGGWPIMTYHYIDL